MTWMMLRIKDSKKKNVDYWLSRLEQTSYEMEDVLDEWNYALLKHKMDQSNDSPLIPPPKHKVCSFVPSSSCLCFNKVVVRRDIAKKIKNVKGRLDQILKQKDQFNFITSQPTTDPSPKSWGVQSTSLIDLGDVHGRDEDKDILVSKLMGNGGGEEKLGNVQVVSIVGVGGLGKTTLAQMVYNDSRVKGCFELRIWICVSDPFDLSAIAKGILESLGKGSSSYAHQLDVLFKHIQDSISGKRFLLVLDDVWTEDYNEWETLQKALRCGGVGSKILVTTRNEKVAKIMGTMHDDIHRPGQLSDKDCWLVMRRMAFLGKNHEVFENFEDIGERIAKKCKGLPLAAKTLGSLLCFKNTLKDWENVLNSEIWEMKEAKVDIFPHLLLTYNELSPPLKRCFSYCGVFLKDQKTHVDELIRYWMALGYLGSEGNMEGRGREYFDILAMHSLFQDFEKDYMDGTIERCKMHDIVHDFAQFLRKNGRLEETTMNKTTCSLCDRELVFIVNEFCSLFWEYEGSSLNLCDCIARLRVLDLQSCRLQGIPSGMENLIHLRSLNLSNNALSQVDLKIIFQLYNMQTLSLRSCDLKEISKEIGNLIQLRYLDLSWNESLEELPREIGNLIQLRHLDVSQNKSLKELPESICGLINLRILDNLDCGDLSKLPEGVGELISLEELPWFHGGSGGNKLGSLKKLNNLSRYLQLRIRLDKEINSKEIVVDAEEAQVRNKIGIQSLKIYFNDEMDEKEEELSLMRMKVLDALEPHPKLKQLSIDGYKGYQLGMGWLVSPHNQLRELFLHEHPHLTSLPPLGKLPCLEQLYIGEMSGLEIVGREFLGTRRRRRRSGEDDMDHLHTITFPKLKRLEFGDCSKLKEWEDITSEEQECENMTLMPCLTET